MTGDALGPKYAVTIGRQRICFEIRRQINIRRIEAVNGYNIDDVAVVCI
jgi:hypothetical protein